MCICRTRVRGGAGDPACSLCARPAAAEKPGNGVPAIRQRGRIGQGCVCWQGGSNQAGGPVQNRRQAKGGARMACAKSSA